MAGRAISPPRRIACSSQDEAAISARLRPHSSAASIPSEDRTVCSVLEKQSVAGEALITQCPFPAEVRFGFNQCLPSFLSLFQSELLKVKAEVNLLPVQSSRCWSCTPGKVLAGEQRGGKEITSTSPSKWARDRTESRAHLWGRAQGQLSTKVWGHSGKIWDCTKALP